VKHGKGCVWVILDQPSKGWVGEGHVLSYMVAGLDAGLVWVV
jgi:hypothetical protein